MRSRRNQRIIIGTLSAVVLGLVVGYATLQQVLNVTGTSSISGDFGIAITKMEESSMNGAQTISKEGLGTTTVSFTVDLKAPGSSAVYNFTVENQGSIDAVLQSIEGIEEANSSTPLDIKYSISGIDENDSLIHGQTQTFQVQVLWDSSATEIPSTNKTLVLKLNYVQKTS